MKIAIPAQQIVVSALHHVEIISVRDISAKTVVLARKIAEHVAPTESAKEILVKIVFAAHRIAELADQCVTTMASVSQDKERITLHVAMIVVDALSAAMEHVNQERM